MTIPLLGFASVVLAALAGYFGIVRRLSGKIATSDAAALWTESAAMRTDLLAINTTLTARIVDLEARIATSDTRNVDAERYNLRLEREALGYQKRIDVLEAAATIRDKEIEKLKDLVDELRTQLKAERES